MKANCEIWGVNIVCIQEPYWKCEAWKGWIVMNEGKDAKVRIWVKEGLKVIERTEYKSNNTVGYIKGEGKNEFLLVNIYDEPGGKRNNRLETIMQQIDNDIKKKPICGDLNAKCVAWGGHHGGERTVIDWCGSVETRNHVWYECDRLDRREARERLRRDEGGLRVVLRDNNGVKKGDTEKINQFAYGTI
ncbi:unnamed protein product [Brassicogethes aeneus]|uniref:Endonuclease/exonuclease/phosphatase domain-containing protein n=1 Tax=Brassicogethes aeneus TaxID=1431903 RepID=A0A9P0BJ64_BRAAE|nr:unnamed protein product [Brassicogethes aeneus]